MSSSLPCSAIVIPAGLLALALYSVALPATAETPQATSARGSDWSNLQRLRLGIPVVIEDVEGKRHEGRLAGVAEDAISVRQRKRVVGLTRNRVKRVWLVGERKVAEGALIGMVAGGIAGAILGGRAAGRSAESVGATALAGGAILGGAGAGAGAALGALFGERALLYRAPPAPRPANVDGKLSAAILPACKTAASLPEPLGKVYRTPTAEELARAAARALGGKGTDVAVSSIQQPEARR